MKYERFEELPVWQSAIDLAAQVYAMTERPAFQKRYSLRDQLERAAVSVSNNVSEGFERGTTQGLLTFLYIARGSAGEVRSMLCLLGRIPGFSDLKSEISNLKSLAESISRQLRGSGGLAPELRHQGPAISDRQDPQNRTGEARTRRVSAKPGPDSPRRFQNKGSSVNGRRRAVVWPPRDQATPSGAPLSDHRSRGLEIGARYLDC